MDQSIKRLFIFIVLVFSFFPISFSVLAQNKQAPKGKVYIPPMHNNLEQTVAKEIKKKKLPLQLVSAEYMADYLIVSPSTRHQKIEWYYAMSQAQTGPSFSLVNRQSYSLIWNYRDKKSNNNKAAKNSKKIAHSNKTAKLWVKKMDKDLY